MIKVCRLETPTSPYVEFDEYVPVTITWPEYHRLLETPTDVVYSSSGHLFELKFHPDSHHLVEAVLANATEIHRIHGLLQPSSTDSTEIACWSEDSSSTVADSQDLPQVTAFDDYLVIIIAKELPYTWVGIPPVLLGVDNDRRLVAMCIEWHEADRKVIMPVSE